MPSLACPWCTRSVVQDAAFCPACCLRIGASGPDASLSRGEWRPSEDEIAARIEQVDVQAWFRKGVQVDDSQIGLIFDSGKLVGHLPSGRSTLQTLTDRIRSVVTGKNAAAVLMRRGVFSGSLLGEARSRELTLFQFTCELGLKVVNEEQFYLQLVRLRNVVLVADAFRLCGPSIREAVTRVVSGCDDADLQSMPTELRTRLIDTVGDAAQERLSQYGMALAFVAPPTFSSEDADAIVQRQAELTQALRTGGVEIEYRSQRHHQQVKAWEVSRESRLAKTQYESEIAAIEAEAEQHQRELDHCTFKNDLRLRESKQTILSDCKTRLSKLREAEADRQSQRQHELDKVEAERSLAMSQLENQLQLHSLLQRQDLDERERAFQIRQRKLAGEAEQTLAETEQSGQLARAERERTFERQQSLLDKQAWAEVQRLEGLASEQQQERERKNLAGLSELQRAHLDAQLDLKAKESKRLEQEKDAAHQRELESRGQSNKHELDTIAAKGDLGLVLEADPSLAPHLVEALRIQQQAGMTAEQLIATGAPETAASALAKQAAAEAEAKHQAFDRERELLERLIDELKRASADNKSQVGDLVSRIEKSGLAGQQALRDVGVATSGGSVSAIETQRLAARLAELLSEKQRAESQHGASGD
ncbi:MAG: hypothetical protein AAGJ46_12810 [Planctomycetota bacterium]